MRAPKKPVAIIWPYWECISEDPDDKGGGVPCVDIEGHEFYTAKDIRRLVSWLNKAEKWIDYMDRVRWTESRRG